MHDSDEELKGGIGLALVLATLLALGAILVADRFGVALFGPDEVTPHIVRQANEKKAATIAALLTHCLNGGSLRVHDHTIDCITRKK